MQLKLKIVYLFPWYFFRVKHSLKMDIVGMMVLFLLEIYASIFSGVPNWVIGSFLGKCFWFWRWHRKMCRCIPLLGAFFIKNRGMCNNLKNALLPHFYVLLWLGRIYTKRGSWAAAKHTTIIGFIFIQAFF